MAVISDLQVIKWLTSAVRFVFWIWRKSGLSDFATTLFLNVSALIALLLYIASIYFEPVISRYFAIQSFNSYWRWGLALLCISSLAWNVGYAVRLRRVGILGVDPTIDSGIDYKASLLRVKKTLDFIGIGAYKLTMNKMEFDQALNNVHSNGESARLLLCDPRSPVLPRLEKLANVAGGTYIANVKQSFVALEAAKRKFGSGLEIRLYVPEDDKDVFTFRCMLIDGALCLLSRNAFGVDGKEGRTAPQLHISRQQVFHSGATLYPALSQLFEQRWKTAIEVSESDFKEINALTSS
jgi:hypothetical protein